MRHGITFSIAHNLRTVGQIACIPLAAVFLLSIVTRCALPARQEGSAGPGKAGSEANARDRKPQYGDLKTVDGVEYIYGKNVRGRPCLASPSTSGLGKTSTPPGHSISHGRSLRTVRR